MPGWSQRAEGGWELETLGCAEEESSFHFVVWCMFPRRS